MDTKIIVERLFDYKIIIGTMDAVWDSISENDIAQYQPNILGEYWLGLFNDSEYLGMFRVHSLTSVMYKGHAFILPDKREFSFECGKNVMKWCLDNIDGMRKMIVEVPECYPNVIDYVNKLGFEGQGYNSDSWSKDGVFGIYQYGMTKQKMIDKVKLWGL